MTGASMRNFIINQKTWGLRLKREGKILEDPAVFSRHGACTEVQKVDKAATNHREKVKTVRAWNLKQNWKFGQVKISFLSPNYTINSLLQVKRVKLVSFNCNHDSCGAKCNLRVRVTLNPPNPHIEDLLPSQVQRYVTENLYKKACADYKWRPGRVEYL